MSELRRAIRFFDSAQRLYVADEHGLRVALVGAEVHGDVVSAVRGEQRGRGADAAARAGDQHDGSRHEVFTLDAAGGASP